LARLQNGTELLRHLFRRDQSLDYFDGEDGS
jgi:hypothetical protein